jgi:cyclic-di-GMP-binding protein
VHYIGRPRFLPGFFIYNKAIYICSYPLASLTYKLTAMPSFDIESSVDIQTLDNAINTVKKEISNRFDFKGSPVEINLDKKDYVVKVEVESDMKMKQVIDVIISRAMKQGIDSSAFDFEKDAYPSGKVVKKEIPVKNGLKQEDAKKIVKLIKDSGMKVQVQIMDEIVRVTGKKIDDLQEVIALCRGGNLGLPLQFVNMKS